MTCYRSAKLRISELENIDFLRLGSLIQSAKELINRSLSEHSNIIITFSGGKDSQVVLDLVRSIDPSIPALFCNTGNEYTETVPFVHTFENVIELRPQKTFWKCVEEYGMPVVKSKAKSHGNQCCFWLKEKPAMDYYKDNDTDLIFTGLTSDESRNRMMFFKRMGPYYFAKRERLWKCHPIHNWTESDVWAYIRLKQLPYNPIYDMGIPRCGCRFCTAYLSWKEVSELYNVRDPQIMMKKMGNTVLEDFV